MATQKFTNFDNFLNAEHLADKIWLMGRSYAASPERRSYKNNNDVDNEENKIKKADDGTGRFFNAIASTLVKDNNFKKLYNNLVLLKNNPLSFNNTE